MTTGGDNIAAVNINFHLFLPPQNPRAALGAGIFISHQNSYIAAYQNRRKNAASQFFINHK